jgi:co-chaperonin GroES (HSP10)
MVQSLNATDEETTEITQPDPDTSGFKLVGHNLLLKPVHIAAKTKGGLLLANKTQHDLSYLINICKVLEVGPTAYTQELFKHPETQEVIPWCAKGDYVLIPRLGGQKIKFKGTPLTIISCDRVIAVLENPADIDPNFNISLDSAY